MQGILLLLFTIIITSNGSENFHHQIHRRELENIFPLAKNRNISQMSDTQNDTSNFDKIRNNVFLIIQKLQIKYNLKKINCYFFSTE